MKIAVLLGGKSAEREVSLNSGKAVADGLMQAGHEVILFDPAERQLTELLSLELDLAFIVLHGRGGEDGCIQGALEYLNIPYTGSGVLGSALGMDKIRCKQIWQTLGLPTANYLIIEQAQYQTEQAEQLLAKLNGMAMVKPCHEGSSVGMAKVSNAQELDQALQQAFVYDSQVLVEQWINGPEYTVAILGETALPSIHMQTPRSFYDYEAKYQSTTTQYHCPSGLNEQDEAELQQLALQAFKAVGASIWGRVDVMRNSQGQWQLLEANTVPGMTKTSLVPKAAAAKGLSFSELVNQIVQLSVSK